MHSEIVSRTFGCMVWLTIITFFQGELIQTSACQAFLFTHQQTAAIHTTDSEATKMRTYHPEHPTSLRTRLVTSSTCCNQKPQHCHPAPTSSQRHTRQDYCFSPFQSIGTLPNTPPSLHHVSDSTKQYKNVRQWLTERSGDPAMTVCKP